jgi:ssDNA-binding Zn-finger/Zn-ribbon topoisomerase 1
VDEIASAILEWQDTLTKSQKANHVSNLKRRHEGLLRVTDSSPRCPFCGAPMVMRTRKSDGGHFYGCSTYPKCTGIVNIRERI